MPDQLKRIMLVGMTLVLLGQCAWFDKKRTDDSIMNPRPVGGYEALATRIHYPKSLRDLGVEGTVVISSHISPNGQVLTTRVTQPLAPELDLIVSNAIRRTLFEPATRKGKPESVWISIPVVFSLKEWSFKPTPFSDFQMAIYPDAAYQNFKIDMQAQLKEDVELPLRIECLLPFNMEKPWAKTKAGDMLPTNLVQDDNGEWLVFQVTDPEFSFGFRDRALDRVTDRKLRYKFAMNHALPGWELVVIYGSQKINFTQSPDRVEAIDGGDTRFEYDLNGLDVYETRYLEVGLQD